MRKLPWRFRTPKGIYGGLAVLTAVLSLLVVPAYYEPAARWAIITPVVLLVVGLWARVPRMGTTVTEDGVTVRGLFGTRDYAWRQIEAVDVHVNNVVSVVGPFQVVPHATVMVRVPRLRTLHFFDDRAYRSVKDLEREYNEFIELWGLRRWRA